MQFISFRVLFRRIKAISSMMKDRSVPKRKKALVIFGILYLFMPLDLIPPVIFPFGFLDDLILWIWILFHLKDTGSVPSGRAGGRSFRQVQKRRYS